MRFEALTEGHQCTDYANAWWNGLSAAENFVGGTNALF